MKNLVFAFGRMQPPTSGHLKLMDKLVSVAKKNNGDAKLYVSQTNDKKKNPLDYKTKVSFIKTMFPKHAKIVQYDTSVKTFFQVLEANDGKYDKVIMVAGSDRVPEYQKLLDKYKSDYKYSSVEVVSAGERDPDADGVSGMSASKIRDLVINDNKEDFMAQYSRMTSSSIAEKLWGAIRKGLNL